MRTKVKYYIVSGRTVETVISRIDINARYQKPRRKLSLIHISEPTRPY